MGLFGDLFQIFLKAFCGPIAPEDEKPPQQQQQQQQQAPYKPHIEHVSQYQQHQQQHQQQYQQEPEKHKYGKQYVRISLCLRLILNLNNNDYAYFSSPPLLPLLLNLFLPLLVLSFSLLSLVSERLPRKRPGSPLCSTPKTGGRSWETYGRIIWGKQGGI